MPLARKLERRLVGGGDGKAGIGNGGFDIEEKGEKRVPETTTSLTAMTAEGGRDQRSEG